MNRQAQLGLFTIAAVAALIFGLYFLTDYGTRSRGYKVGIHFQSAAGLHQAALVYLSGVPIGVVDSIVLLDDYSTDVIIAVKQRYEIPRGSRFLIQAPLTGDPSLLIVPPPPASTAKDKAAAERALAVLPHEVLPLDQQPVGHNSSSIADLLDEGQGQIRRLDRILAQVETATPELLRSLQSTVHSANDLTNGAHSSVTLINERVAALTDQLSQLLVTTGGNVNDLTRTLDSTAKTSSVKVDALLNQLNKTSRSLAATTESLQSLAADPKLRQDLLATSHQIAITTKTIADIAGDLRQVTGNPETQAQLRDTIANLDAATQRINSLAGSLGGRSDVYGVDRGAPKPGPSGSPGPQSAATAAPRARIGILSGRFVAAVVRLSVVNSSPTNTDNPNVLTADGGAQADLGILVLPRNPTNLFLSLNDIGGNQTTSLGIQTTPNGHFTYGGGLLYSRLGLVASLQATKLGAEVRAYDLHYPTIDGYGRYFLTPGWQLFAGERDILHASRRTTFGVQAQF